MEKASVPSGSRNQGSSTILRIEKNAGRDRKTGKINNKMGGKQPQQSVMICVPSRIAVAGR